VSPPGAFQGGGCYIPAGRTSGLNTTLAAPGRDFVGEVVMLLIEFIVIGLPLTLLIYLAYRLLKRPATIERSVEISAITLSLVKIVPFVVIFLFGILTVLLLARWLLLPGYSMFHGFLRCSTMRRFGRFGLVCRVSYGSEALYLLIGR
jgi:hypothetical protein